MDPPAVEPEAVDPEAAQPEAEGPETPEAETPEPEAAPPETAAGEPTRDDVDALVGPATPHFAYQLRARLEELVSELPEGHDVRRYAEEKMELLDRLGHASSKAVEGKRESPARLGWDELPSSAPADEPLARRTA
jgi:hypothetical protein